MPVLAKMLSSLLGGSTPVSPQDPTTTTAPATTAAAAAAVPVAFSSSYPKAQTSSPSAPRQTAEPPPHDSSMLSSRSLKQLGLFFAGATFLALSTTITRRSVVRKQLAAQLKFYSPSGTGTTMLGGSGSSAEAAAAAASATKEEAPHGSFMAVEALNLATLNVLSFFVMLTGGVSWALDLSSLDDLRTLARRYTRGPALDGSTGGGGGLTDEEAEREVEEWVAKILTKKDGGLLGGTKKENEEPKKK